MEKVFNLFELMKLVQKRPGMYLLRKKSIYDLLNFKYWYQIGVSRDNNLDDLIEIKKFHKFQDYIIEKTIWMNNRTNDCYLSHDCLLKVTNNDEGKAFDLFFELMDEFIAIENIVIDLPPPPDYAKMAQEWDNWKMSEGK